MHLDEPPSCLDTGSEKTNMFAPQYLDITGGWALWVSFYPSGLRPTPRSVLQTKRGTHFSVKAGPEDCAAVVWLHVHTPTQPGCGLPGRGARLRRSLEIDPALNNQRSS